MSLVQGELETKRLQSVLGSRVAVATELASAMAAGKTGYHLLARHSGNAVSLPHRVKIYMQLLACIGFVRNPNRAEVHFDEVWKTAAPFLFLKSPEANSTALFLLELPKLLLIPNSSRSNCP